MPNIKKPRREEPPNQVAPNPNATQRAIDLGTPTPTTTGETENRLLDAAFTVSTEGCTVRLAFQPQRYLLALTLPNYNALFSLLLACWLDRQSVLLTYRIPLALDPDAPLSIVSITARKEAR